MTHRLTRDEARRIIVRAQLLDARRPGDVVEVAEQLGYIKIDPTATIAPAEQTILWSRIGWSYEAGQLTKAVEGDRLLFEYEGAFRPVSLLPLLLPGMRAWPTRESSRQWLDANAAFRADVLARLRAEGPLLASDIPDTATVSRAPDGWSGSNQVPHMLDFLTRQGEVAVAGRAGRHKRWDLAERVYPQDLPSYPADQAARMLGERRLQAAGLAKQRSPWTPVGDAGEPVVIDGSARKYRVDPYVLEQFKPKAQRRYGFFAHPILFGDRFIGMLDAAVDRDAGVLRVDAIHEFVPFDDDEAELVRAELHELAEWLGVALVGPA